jgi:hypothetical protein
MINPPARYVAAAPVLFTQRPTASPTRFARSVAQRIASEIPRTYVLFSPSPSANPAMLTPASSRVGK